MSQLSRLITGARALFRHRADEKELAEELQAYVDDAAEHKMRSGSAHQDALRAARVEMGSAEAVKDEVRAAGWESVVFSFFQDLRYGCRMLWKTPGVTVICLITFGLAIGVNAAIFSVVNWLVLRPLPVHDPKQLVFLAYPRPGQHFDERFSWTEIQQLRTAGASAFSESAALMFGGIAGGSASDGLTVDGQTERVEPVYVTGSFFTMLGVKPHLGRLLQPSEGEVEGADPVVVLSYRYWKQRFGSDPSIVGKKALLDGHPVTIVGIGPEGFVGVTPLIDMQAYIPLGMAAEIGATGRDFYSNSQTRAALMLARLQPGITRDRAAQVLAATGTQLQQEFPRAGTSRDLMVRALRPPGLINGPNPLPAVAALFLTLAGLVLVLAAVNVAALLLVRAIARGSEMAMRAALGATRQRLMRQMFTESVLLALLGCVVGTGVGLLAISLFRSVPFQTDEPLNLAFTFDWRVFSYLAVLAVVTGVLVGISPALRAIPANLNQVLHSAARGSSAVRQRIRTALVVTQVAGALALIITAALFVRSLIAAEHANLGFNPQQVLNVSFDPHEIGYDKQRADEFYRALDARISSLPGVRAVSFAAAVPLGDSPLETGIVIPGRAVQPSGEQPTAWFNAVTPGYLDSMGMTLLRGRTFSPSDASGNDGVALITPTMAKRYWPGQDPIGNMFAMADEPKRLLRIIGVVNDSRYSQVYGPYDALFFVPLAQHSFLARTLQVRAEGDPSDLAESIKRAIDSIDHSMPVYGVQTMADALHSMNGLQMFELAAGIAAVLGGVGLLLSIVGVYGVLSFSVSQRTREIGIRLALGSTRGAVLRLVLRQGFTVVAAGLALGIGIATLLGLVTGDFLVGVSGSDPATYIAVTSVLTVVSLLAISIPARRATHIDPAVALRAE